MENKMTNGMKRALSICALTVASMGASSVANAQVTFQGVTFTPSYSGNVLTLEIDAANPTGDWATADFIGALQIKSIGSWDSVTLTGTGAAGTWTIAPDELTANGCDGGSAGNQRACAFGTLIPLANDMIFQFTFTGGTQDFSLPHIKVLMFEAGNPDKVGSLMSLDVPAIPEPSTYAMLLGGLGLLAVARRNAKKNAA
jgi:hypothetical protein